MFFAAVWFLRECRRPGLLGDLAKVREPQDLGTACDFPLLMSKPSPSAVDEAYELPPLAP